MKIKYIQQGCQIVIFWGFFNFFQLFLTFHHFSSPFHSEYVKSDFRDFWSKTSGASLLKSECTGIHKERYEVEDRHDKRIFT